MSRCSIRFVATVLIATLIGFGLGLITGTRVTTSLRSARPVVDESKGLQPLADENERIKIALQRVVAALAAAKVQHEFLRTDESNAPREDRMGAPPPRHEIQLSVLKNLGFLKIIRDRYHREHGRDPVSIHELVGPGSVLKRLISVDGEDYSTVSLRQGDTLTVTTAGGITVWCRDQSGPDAESQVDYPADEARFREMEKAQRNVIMAATEAYRTANGGKDVSKDLQLLPFFSTPQQAADYLELIEAMKAAGKY